MLNEKFNDEFKNRYVIISKTNNFNDFITFLRNIDANVKKINNQSHLRIKQNIFVIFITVEYHPRMRYLG